MADMQAQGAGKEKAGKKCIEPIRQAACEQSRAVCFSQRGGICIAREKTTGIYFKVSEQDREYIQRRMAQTGIRNLSAYIRKMCIDGYVINLDMKQLDEVSRLLRITANNVNQLARRVNSGGQAYREDVTEVSAQFTGIREQFGSILKGLSQIK